MFRWRELFRPYVDGGGERVLRLLRGSQLGYKTVNQAIEDIQSIVNTP